jgi:hypothetical protein
MRGDGQKYLKSSYCGDVIGLHVHAEILGTIRERLTPCMQEAWKLTRENQTERIKEACKGKKGKIFRCRSLLNRRAKNFRP